jgi:hypothetical protein
MGQEKTTMFATTDLATTVALSLHLNPITSAMMIEGMHRGSGTEEEVLTEWTKWFQRQRGKTFSLAWEELATVNLKLKRGEVPQTEASAAAKLFIDRINGRAPMPKATREPRAKRNPHVVIIKCGECGEVMERRCRTLEDAEAVAMEILGDEHRCEKCNGLDLTPDIVPVGVQK